MRSSKSRSRNKNNRSNNNNRSAVNIVNRVFDSSGPEGKVRGTPQQIIDKYTQLARDAQLSNDRVAAENFQQHAEHYLRMLGEAQREIDARRDQDLAQQAQRDRNQHNNNTQSGGANAAYAGGGEQPPSYQQPQSQPEASEPAATARADTPEAQPEAPAQSQPRARRQRAPRAEQSEQQPPRDTAPAAARDDAALNDVIDTGDDNEASGLVDTPESKPGKPRRPRSKPRPKPAADAPDQAPATPKAAE